MKRYTGQKALYEAINRSQGKTERRGGILERLRPILSGASTPAPKESKPQVEPAPTPTERPKAPVEKPQAATERPAPVSRPRPVEKIGRAGTSTPAQNWLRPKPVQLNGGRIEISVPYYVGATVVLALVLLVLVAFKLGQAGRPEVTDGTEPAVAAADTVSPPSRQESSTRREPPQETAPTTRRQAPGTPAAVERENPPARATSTGDNWIVLTRYDERADLVPVVEHFAEHGIELLIVPLGQARATFDDLGLNASVLPGGDGYLLVTADTYENPGREGTDGYMMKQEIARVGALYKGEAPSGYESFAPNYFSDAYGMKIR